MRRSVNNGIVTLTIESRLGERASRVACYLDRIDGVRGAGIVPYRDHLGHRWHSYIVDIWHDAEHAKTEAAVIAYITMAES